MKEIRECEAPEHVPECSGYGETQDHFTPKCIAKEIGLNHKQINSPLNLQWLSKPCHQFKDKTTPQKLEQVRFQQSGGMILFGQHK